MQMDRHGEIHSRFFQFAKLSKGCDTTLYRYRKIRDSMTKKFCSKGLKFEKFHSFRESNIWTPVLNPISNVRTDLCKICCYIIFLDYMPGPPKGFQSVRVFPVNNK
jgi:hypothetical protein